MLISITEMTENSGRWAHNIKFGEIIINMSKIVMIVPKGNEEKIFFIYLEGTPEGSRIAIQEKDCRRIMEHFKRSKK